MYEAVTNGVRVRVEPDFDPQRSDPDESYYFWLYTIEISNDGEVPVQLMERHWRITDSLGTTEEVQGPGVVGQTPLLAPGESFTYTSGCPLRTPSGIMLGTYRMIDDTGDAFEVEIPAFSLDSPFASHQMN
ncbi:MAG: Co2+/Mg2+ efflux protein ApaG [Pseudomonadota bacterium]